MLVCTDVVILEVAAPCWCMLLILIVESCIFAFFVSVKDGVLLLKLVLLLVDHNVMVFDLSQALMQTVNLIPYFLRLALLTLKTAKNCLGGACFRVWGQHSDLFTRWEL